MKSLINPKGGKITPLNPINDGSSSYQELLQDNIISFILNKLRNYPEEVNFYCSGSEQLSLLPLKVFISLLPKLNKNEDIVIKNKNTVSAIKLINVLSYLVDYKGIVCFKGGNEMLSFIPTEKYKKKTVVIEIKERIDFSKIVI